MAAEGQINYTSKLVWDKLASFKNIYWAKLIQAISHSALFVFSFFFLLLSFIFSFSFFLFFFSLTLIFSCCFFTINFLFCPLSLFYSLYIAVNFFIWLLFSSSHFSVYFSLYSFSFPFLLPFLIIIFFFPNWSESFQTFIQGFFLFFITLQGSHKCEIFSWFEIVELEFKYYFLYKECKDFITVASFKSDLALNNNEWSRIWEINVCMNFDVTMFGMRQWLKKIKKEK